MNEAMLERAARALANFDDETFQCDPGDHFAANQDLYLGRARAVLEAVGVVSADSLREILADHKEVGDHKAHEDTYKDGWTDAVNEITWAIDTAIVKATAAQKP